MLEVLKKVVVLVFGKASGALVIETEDDNVRRLTQFAVIFGFGGSMDQLIVKFPQVVNFLP